MSGPLSSLKIMDFSTLLPGPFASMMLADMGAQVLRIEAPHRPDMIRMMPPFDGDTSAWHALLNRSKRSLALDLKKPKAVEVIKRLVQTYDIVLEQFRPGVMERLGVGYEALRAANPSLIYCAVTGYGQTGPLKDRAGHDINYLALSGVMNHIGRKENGPLPLSLQVADIGGGSYGAVTGILAAVIHRMQTGEGQFVDISMLDASIAWNSLAASEYLISGEERQREKQQLNGGSFYDFYRTADGRYLSVGSLEPKFWNSFCQTIERPDLIKERNDQLPAQQRALKAEIQQTIARRPLNEWLNLFATVDACVEPVLNTAEMLEHAQTQARKMLIEVPKPDGTTQPQIASPYKFSATSPTYQQIGAKLGAHTQEALLEVGYSQEEIAQMQAEKLFGEHIE